MTRKAWFWILFVLVSAGVLAFAIPNFSRTFSVISLDLKMNRADALAAASDLAHRLQLGPGAQIPDRNSVADDSPIWFWRSANRTRRVIQHAASFGVDDTVKTYVELEGGGAAAFKEMLREHRYDAYTWKVRLFREGETREATLQFRPDGAPYGFIDHLREDAPGASLPADSARALAEAAARRDWGVDLGLYAPVETSMEHRPGGRTDHTFVYERRDAVVGDGRYRLRLVLGGDRLTEVTHLVRVPEAFSRKYEKMRSSNDAIAFGAQATMAVLFIIGGCVVGLFLLMRGRWLWWRPALFWGFFICALEGLTIFNAWPLAWMGYDTAVSGSTFLLRQTMFAILVFIADGCLVSLTLVAAESLGRRAFPQHPQLWRAWSRDATTSRAIVGRTLGGTLLTGVEFGYIIAFYLIATKLWKWWTPAEALVDPDILATYVPWLSAVAPSLHAGFWEEALFRAVPLAGAALIGDRLGNRKLWLGIGLVVEALVFGGAHANYPSWPAYSRPLELFVPSLIWGLVYLRFGLIPSIITHYLFDLSLFSLPLFSSNASGSHIDQIAVIVCGAVPLLVVAWGLVRRPQLVELPESLRNGGWSPPAEEPEVEAVPVETPAGSWSPALTRLAFGLGFAGLIAWATLGHWKTDAPVIGQRRSQALESGLAALRERGYQADPKWRKMVTIDTDGIQSVFVWRALGQQVYHALIGHDLAPPHWEVRLASFRGDVVERAEEWQAWIAGDGSTFRARHVLPDGRKGASLDEGTARPLAEEELKRHFLVDPATLKEVSAVSTKHPGRLDWTFVFADPAPSKLAKGERRISIEIAGDRVSDAYRFVFVPEDWNRQYRRENATMGVLGLVRGLLLAAIVIMSAAFGIVAWSRRTFPVKFAVRFFLLFVIVGLLGSVCSWPRIEARLSTAQPLELQVAIVIASLLLVQGVIAALFALVAGWSLTELPGTSDRPRVSAGASLAIGAFAAGLITAMAHFSTSGDPILGDFSGAQSLLPWAQAALSTVGDLLTRTATLLALFMLARRIGAAGGARRWMAMALLLVVGGITVASGSASTIGGWFAAAGLTGVGLVLLDAIAVSRDPRVLPGVLAGVSILATIRGAVRHAYPDVMTGAVLELVAIAFVTWWWWRELNGGHAVTVPEATPVPVTTPA